jgi:hypothetical protein
MADHSSPANLNLAPNTKEFSELCDEPGIKSINLDSTVVDAADAQGNTKNRSGSFEKSG